MKKHKMTGTRKRSKAGRPRRALGDTTDFWDHFFKAKAKTESKAKPKAKTKPKPKPKAVVVNQHPRKRVKPMATKKEAKHEEETPETLPPPDPPKVKSEPTEPPAPDAVIEQDQLGAQPEDQGAVRELDLIPESTYARGEGPQPEEPEEAEEETGKAKKEKKEKNEED